MRTTLNVQPDYRVRFVTREQGVDLVNLYHLARTALAGTGKDTPYDRMLWACKAFAAKYPQATGAYKDLCGLLGR